MEVRGPAGGKQAARGCAGARSRPDLAAEAGSEALVGRREFVCQDDRSDKYWTVEVSGCVVTTTYGRIGAAPRETRLECATPEAAQRECLRLVNQKLRKGYVEGAVADAAPRTPPDWASMAMSDDVFWRLIGLLDWRKGDDEEAVLEPAVRALAKMGAEGAMRFEDTLARMLHALDTEAHARAIGEYAYGVGEYFSVDLFLYVRCLAVARGRAFYEAALSDPTAMPKDAEFETLLYLAAWAYERATDEEFEYSPPVCFETFSNAAGWGQTEPTNPGS